MKKTNLFLVLIAIIIASCCMSCDRNEKPSADRELQNKTELSMQEANRQVGMPGIVNFQEKKIMKSIYELRDQENLICYAYLYNRDSGTVGQFLGKCIGYGLPYSTQFSNPQKMVSGAKMLGYSTESYQTIQTLPQPEPNGLFMPEGLSATWLLLIDPDTKKPRPVYVEPEIIVSPFKLH
jgi:hypothetical protein